MFCKSCGAEVNPNEKFCKKCGQIISKSSKKTGMNFILIIPLLLALIIIALFFNKGLLLDAIGGIEREEILVEKDTSQTYIETETTSYIVETTQKRVETFHDLVSKANVVTNYSGNSTVEDFDVVKFGKYYKGSSSSKEDIEWIVLEKNTSPDGRNYALLLSKYVLDCVQYNTVYDYTFWESSSIRQWVNNNFYNSAFNNTEKDSIIEMPRDNPRNEVYPAVEGGSNTIDKVFLLSFAECKEYFGGGASNKNLKLATKATDYAISKGAYKQISDGAENGNTMYWLRSPGNTKMNACDISPTGYLNYDGNMVSLPQGIRPTIFVWY